MCPLYPPLKDDQFEHQLNRKKKHLPEGWDTSHLLLCHLNLHRTCKTLQDKPVKKKIKTTINITNFVHFTHVTVKPSQAYPPRFYQ